MICKLLVISERASGLPLPDDEIDSDTEVHEFSEAKEDFERRTHAHGRQVLLRDLESVQITKLW